MKAACAELAVDFRKIGAKQPGSKADDRP